MAYHEACQFRLMCPAVALPDESSLSLLGSLTVFRRDDPAPVKSS